MNSKDSQCINSNSDAKSYCFLNHRMDVDEWEVDLTRHHKSLSERRKCKLIHAKKKKCLSIIDE